MGQACVRLPSDKDFDTLNEMIEREFRTSDLVHFMKEKHITRDAFLEARQRAFYYNHHIDYPVHTATMNGRVQILDVLFRFGFKSRDPKLHWMDPVFHLACMEGQFAIVRWLVNKCGVDVEEPDLYPVANPPLIWAAKGGQVKILLFLIDTGSSVNVSNGNNETALHYAACGNQSDICDCLISQGADINARDDCGKTPLHKAVAADHEEPLRILLKAGADVNLRDECGETPFFYAARQGRPILMDILFSYNADTQTVTNTGLTPLNVCIKYDYSYEVVRKLVVDMNMDLDRRECDVTPMHLAIEYGRYVFVDLLLSAGYRPQRNDYIPKENTDCVRKLSDKVRDIACTPRKLQDICSLRIRRALGRRLSKGVSCLPLPPKLKAVVGLKHLKDRPSPYLNHFKEYSTTS